MKLLVAGIAALAAVDFSDARLMHRRAGPPDGYAPLKTDGDSDDVKIKLNFFLAQPKEGIAALEALMMDRSDPSSQSSSPVVLVCRRDFDRIDRTRDIFCPLLRRSLNIKIPLRINRSR